MRTSLAFLMCGLLIPIDVGSVSAKPLPIQEPTSLGIKVANELGGVHVLEIFPDRPIGVKLQIGDILIAYRATDRQVSPTKMTLTDDVTALKQLLLSGISVEVTLLRKLRKYHYRQMKIVLEPSDLVTKTAVEEKTSTYTVSVPYSADPINVGKEANGIITVKVPYATDRLLQRSQYSGERDGSDIPLKYGVATVTLPPNHRKGRLERPWWIFKAFENPRRHVFLHEVVQSGRDGFLNTLRESFENATPDQRRVLVFVHGYNTAFEEAARRAAQLHYDLEFPGVTTFFSWPSDGKTERYPSDEDDIAWSTHHLQQYLSLLDQSDNVDEIYIIAHSMGNRGVSQALMRMTRDGRGGKVREVIMAAPDVDAQTFERDVAPTLCDSFPRLTIYASSRDVPLMFSKTIHKNKRLGEIVGNLPTIGNRGNLDIIDASLVETSMLGHSHYADGDSIIADMYYLLREELPVERRRNLQRTSYDRGVFWIYRP